MGQIGRSDTIHPTRSSQFGSDTRFKYEAESKRRASTPGPGAYSVSGSIGWQMMSTKPTGAAFGFGSGDRKHSGKVYISSEHAKTVNLDASPGPATLALPSAFGKSSSTRGHTSNSWSFGKADRFGDTRQARAANTPGPGAYSV
jgi:hypothetical protein